MKCVKMFGLAALAAMALTAFIGASSASATVLCATNETPCAVGWHYSTGTVIHATIDSGTTATLKSTGGLIENTCTGFTVRAVTENTGGANETVKATVATSELIFSNCTNTTDVLEGGTIEIHHIAGTMNGTLTGRRTETTMNLGGVSCTYGSGEEGAHLGTITGGSPATIDLRWLYRKLVGGFLCPSDLTWEANLSITSPTPLYISES